VGLESSARAVPAGVALGMVGRGATPEPPPPWTVEFAEGWLELRDIDSGFPVDALAPETTYELHYEGKADDLTGYVLFVVADSADHGIAGAAPPPDGDWAATGSFHALDLDPGGEADKAFTADGYPAGYVKADMVTHDIPPGYGSPGSSGGLGGRWAGASGSGTRGSLMR